MGGLFWPPVSLALTQLNGPSMGSADVMALFGWIYRCAWVLIYLCGFLFYENCVQSVH
jgi:hypothetical protein